MQACPAGQGDLRFFVEDLTHEAKKYRMLKIIGEDTHECLAIGIDRRLRSIDVIDVLSVLFILYGVPGYIRSDNGPEFVAKAVQNWITAVGAKTAWITPGSPRANHVSRNSVGTHRALQRPIEG